MMTAPARLTAAQALRRAAARAILAPSIYNSQPWRFVLSKGVLELYADRSRQLQVVDPVGRQLLISCGCALFNARVALAAAGYVADVHRLPESGRPGLLARLSADEPAESIDHDLSVLDPAIELRHTNRRRFADDSVPAELIDALVAAAAAEGANLLPIRDERQLAATVALSQRATALAESDPAYRSELRAWSTDEPGRTQAMPPLGTAPVGDRRYDTYPARESHDAGSDVATHPGVQECLLLLWTPDDDPLAWVRAGEGLQRMLLELTRDGYVAAITSQVAEVPAMRAMLRRELDLPGAAHLLLRVGRAPLSSATRRRRLVEVLIERL